MACLKTLGKAVYNLVSDQETEEIVHAVLNGHEGEKSSVDELCLIELIEGTIVDLVFPGNKLEILYLGDFKFIVVRDLAHVL